MHSLPYQIPFFFFLLEFPIPREIYWRVMERDVEWLTIKAKKFEIQTAT